MNGRPGRRIAHARGLRQGDPLSPMLFVLVMEVLNSLIREADRRAALSPLPGRVRGLRALLYADDLVILIAPTGEDLRCLLEILELFAGALGLTSNPAKCIATPISCDEETLAAVQAAFPCSVVNFPCRYLGIPLSLKRLSRADELPLIDAVAGENPDVEGGSLDECREGYPHQSNSISNTCSPQHCLLPIVLGHRADRQEEEGVHLDR